MLPLLAVSLILYLASMSGKWWTEKLPPKMQNDFVVTSFRSVISFMVSCPFREKWEAGVWNQGIFKIIFYILSASYVEIIRESTISRVFYHTAVALPSSINENFHKHLFALHVRDLNVKMAFADSDETLFLFPLPSYWSLLVLVTVR